MNNYTVITSRMLKMTQRLWIFSTTEYVLNILHFLFKENRVVKLLMAVASNDRN